MLFHPNPITSSGSIQLPSTHLGNSVRVPKDDSDLGGGQPLLGQLEDLVLHLVRSDLQPLGDGPKQSRWKRDQTQSIVIWKLMISSLSSPQQSSPAK